MSNIGSNNNSIFTNYGDKKPPQSKFPADMIDFPESKGGDFLDAAATSVIKAATAALINQIRNSTDSLQLPGNKTYTIQAGDSLSKIAQKEIGKTATPAQIEKFIEKVVILNKHTIKDENHIQTGDTISIPKNSGSTKGNAEGFSKLDIDD